MQGQLSLETIVSQCGDDGQNYLTLTVAVQIKISEPFLKNINDYYTGLL